MSLIYDKEALIQKDPKNKELINQCCENAKQKFESISSKPGRSIEMQYLLVSELVKSGLVTILDKKVKK